MKCKDACKAVLLISMGYAGFAILDNLLAIVQQGTAYVNSRMAAATIPYKEKVDKYTEEHEECEPTQAMGFRLDDFSGRDEDNGFEEDE